MSRMMKPLHLGRRQFLAGLAAAMGSDLGFETLASNPWTFFWSKDNTASSCDQTIAKQVSIPLVIYGDLCLDSYHFGGCNTIADGLYLRKPTVTWEGDKWYNRIGAQMQIFLESSTELG